MDSSKCFALVDALHQSARSSASVTRRLQLSFALIHKLGRSDFSPELGTRYDNLQQEIGYMCPIAHDGKSDYLLAELADFCRAALLEMIIGA